MDKVHGVSWLKIAGRFIKREGLLNGSINEVKKVEEYHSDSSIGSRSDKGDDLKKFPTSSSYQLLTQSSSSDRGSILDFEVSLYASDVLIYGDFIRAGASIQSLLVEDIHVETSRNQSNGFTPRFGSMQVRKDMKAR
ncbi:hypothetical protein BY996DRAFT_6469421 [Phakopsora pachyrhizi]|nr:hypothetical protein BY996DRAFT_6469421 [Phakopsora pachyrhizi]